MKYGFLLAATSRRLKAGSSILSIGIIALTLVTVAYVGDVVGVTEAQQTGGNFYVESAKPKSDKTWIASITCRSANGSLQTIGGTGNPGVVRNAVANAIRQRGLPYTIPAEPLVRSDGKWDTNQNLHLPTLTAVCQILGYQSFVSSTCRDEERSGTYPRGKCNFHSPYNNVLYRFQGTVQQPQCSDGIDNDGDGATDLSDFSCSGSTDNDETNPKAQCQDGVDNDGDGKTDYPQDPGCTSKQDNDEYNQVQQPQCSDGIDNDGDGATDLGDFSCSGPTDNDETNPKAQCQDGLDNDADGKTDYPQDPGCTSKQDNDEYNQVQQGSIQVTLQRVVPAGNLPITPQYQKLRYYFEVKNTGAVTVTGIRSYFPIPINPPVFKQILDMSNACVIEGSEVECDWPSDLPVTLLPGQMKAYYIVLDTVPPLPCNFSISARVRTISTNAGTVYSNTLSDAVQCASSSSSSSMPPAQCSDGIDNDGDGATDLSDFSCSGPTDNDETNPKAQCQDGLDNDGDGKTDYPQDPGCTSKQDNDEYNPVSSSSSSMNTMGCIEILKETFYAHGSQLWPVPQFTFKLNNNRTVLNDAEGYARFDDVPAGMHTVTEIVPQGWELFLITPEGGQVQVNAGTNCAGLTFKNRQNVLGSSSNSQSSGASSAYGNLIPNPSFEQEGDYGKPQYWHEGGWGTNNAQFSYPAEAKEGSRGASVTMTQYTDGDAKWYFDDISAAPGKQYSFSNWYKSTAETSFVVRYTMQDGSVQYVWIGNAPASGSWDQFSASFTAPANIKELTIFHVLSSVGTLAVDAYDLR